MKIFNIKEGFYNRNRLPEFIMAVGIPGSGKSSYLKKHIVNKLIVSSDDIRRELFGDVNNQENNNIIFDRAIGRVEGVLLVGKGVALDSTNVEFLKWSKMIEHLPKCYKIAWVFDCYPNVAYDRIVKDKIFGKDRSDVPKEIVFQKYEYFKETVKKLSDYFDKVVYYSSMVNNEIDFIVE